VVLFEDNDGVDPVVLFEDNDGVDPVVLFEDNDGVDPVVLFEDNDAEGELLLDKLFLGSAELNEEFEEENWLDEELLPALAKEPPSWVNGRFKASENGLLNGDWSIEATFELVTLDNSWIFIEVGRSCKLTPTLSLPLANDAWLDFKIEFLMEVIFLIRDDFRFPVFISGIKGIVVLPEALKPWPWLGFTPEAWMLLLPLPLLSSWSGPVLEVPIPWLSPKIGSVFWLASAPDMGLT
jgi:hypothetical protein